MIRSPIMHWTNLLVDLMLGLSRTQRRSHMKTNHLHQIVIVTGGATGIGYAVAAQFVECGANVLLNSRTRAKLAAAAEKLGKADRVAFLAADITEPANAQMIVDPRSSASAAWMCWRTMPA